MEKTVILSVSEPFHENSLGGVQYTYKQDVGQDVHLDLGHTDVESSQRGPEEPTYPWRNYQYVLSGSRVTVASIANSFRWYVFGQYFQ